MKEKFQIKTANAHKFRGCTPETCSCSTDYVVYTYKVLANVNTEEDGKEWIKKYHRALEPNGIPERVCFFCGKSYCFNECIKYPKKGKE